MTRYVKAREFDAQPFTAANVQGVVAQKLVHACGHEASDEKWALYTNSSSTRYYIEHDDLASLLRFFNDVFTRKACGPECEERLVKEQRKAKAAARKANGTAEKKAAIKAAANPYANLPAIIDVLGTDDYGEYGAALCPHCGAEGRYIKHVLCDDGTERGVMAGCFKRFPQHAVVEKIAYYQDKWEEYKKKGWSLSRFDQQIFDGVQAMRNGAISADGLLDIIRDVARQREQWQKRRGR